MKRVFPILICVLAALSCTRGGGGEPHVQDELVSVQLALRVGAERPADPAKGNPSVITEMNEVFRGIEYVTLVPFQVQRTIQEGDRSVFHPSYLPGISSLIAGNHAFLYTKEEVALPGGTASVLAYGLSPEADAATEIEKMHLNGALEPVGLGALPELRHAGDIGFRPVKIYSGGLPAEAQTIADILTAVVGQATVTTDYYYYALSEWKSGQAVIVWDEHVADQRLADYFNSITDEGRLTTGAGRNVEYMLTRLYRLMSDFESFETIPYEHSAYGQVYPAYKTIGGSEPLTWADLYDGLAALITGRIEALRDAGTLNISGTGEVTFADEALSVYPSAYGLPEGAAVVRWDGIQYNPVSQELDGVAPLSSYCYPPRLWYYANTLLSTSSKDLSAAYDPANVSWQDDILALYRNGHVVHGYTKSAALDNPLQYSCGMLVASVRASSASLTDAAGKSVALSGNNIAITGVILGGQQNLGYDFTPAGGADSFLYDSCISGVNLAAVSAQNAPVFRTLVSQTPDDTPVYFCLELRNDTGESFTGADGNVLPGGKFYLLGTIELPDDGSYERAFEKDCTTRVNCVISSLAEARTAVPDLEHPTLSMGLQLAVNWVEATSSYVILY